jgi:hypothetical protein
MKKITQWRVLWFAQFTRYDYGDQGDVILGACSTNEEGVKCKVLVRNPLGKTILNVS